MGYTKGPTLTCLEGHHRDSQTHNQYLGPWVVDNKILSSRSPSLSLE